jgi:hypothetical protein
MQSQTASYVLTTLVTPPATTALTSLAHVKDELDIPDIDTSNDSRLTRFIKEESAAVCQYCNRVFGFATWADQFRPQHGIRGEGVRSANNPLQLAKWPLATGAVAFVGDTHSSVLVDNIASTAGLYEDLALFGAGIPAGTTIASVAANSITLSSAATATASAVPLTAGLQVIETLASIPKELTQGTDFEVDRGSGLAGDEGAGRLYRLNELGHPRTWPPAKIIVTYMSGYALPDDEFAPQIATLPEDLESACIRLVVFRYRARGRDPTLVERNQPNSIGTERYWVGGTPGQRGGIAPEIAGLLDNYRVPVVA